MSTSASLISLYYVLQGLLWTAAGLLVRSDAKANPVLIYTLAALGALLALVTALSVKMSNMAVELLVGDLDNGDTRNPTPVIGLYGPWDKPKIQGRLNKFILFLNGYEIVPLTLVITWVVFASLV